MSDDELDLGFDFEELTPTAGVEFFGKVITDMSGHNTECHGTHRAEARAVVDAFGELPEICALAMLVVMGKIGSMRSGTGPILQIFGVATVEDVDHWAMHVGIEATVKFCESPRGASFLSSPEGAPGGELSPTSTHLERNGMDGAA